MAITTLIILVSLFYGYSSGVQVLDHLVSLNDTNATEKWFIEIDKDYSELASSMKIEQVCYHSQSKYQEIFIFNNKEMGNVLTLNGIIQLTEWDEFAYHEMAINIPLFAHPHPKNVLIIGGGDGGSVREAIKHSTVEKVVLAEIDEEVINASRKCFPKMAASMDDPKVRIHIGDGFEYLRQCAQRARAVAAGNVTEGELYPDVPEDGQFDVIITDNSNMEDEGSPNEALFAEEYYKNIHDVLRAPHGIMSSLVGGHWLFKNLHIRLNKLSHKMFPTHRFAVLNVPTWTGGTEGLLLASLNPNADLEHPHKDRIDEVNKMKLHHYNPRLHKAVFALPQFILDAFENSEKEQKEEL